jgi:hypothetical protein
MLMLDEPLENDVADDADAPDDANVDTSWTLTLISTFSMSRSKPSRTLETKLRSWLLPEPVPKPVLRKN